MTVRKVRAGARPLGAPAVARASPSPGRRAARRACRRSGCATRRDVVAAEELGVHDQHHLAAQPSPARDDVGDTPRRVAVVERHTHRVDGHLRRRTGARRSLPPHVRARSPPATPRSRIGSPRVRCQITQSRSVAIGRHDPEVGRAHRRLAPRLTLADRHRSALVGCARQVARRLGVDRSRPRSTPRPRRGTAGRRPVRHVRRVSRSGATIASWRSTSISCFIVRTKSPPDSSSCLDHLGEALARRPGERDGDERRIGRPVHRQTRPPPRSPPARS